MFKTALGNHGMYVDIIDMGLMIYESVYQSIRVYLRGDASHMALQSAPLINWVSLLFFVKSLILNNRS